MPAENLSSLFGQPPRPALGKLMAIELPEHFQAHVRPFHPDQRAAFENLARARLELIATSDHDTDMPTNKQVADATAALTAHDDIDSLSFGIFENAPSKTSENGRLLGCVALRRDAEARRNIGMRLRTLLPQPQDPSIPLALQSIVIYGQDHWNVQALTMAANPEAGPAPWDRRPPYKHHESEPWIDLRNSLPARIQLLQGLQYLYASPFKALGTVRAELYNQPDFYDALMSDIEVSEEYIILGGLRIMENPALKLAAPLARAVRRGAVAELYIPCKPSGAGKRIIEKLEKAGAEVHFHNISPHAANLGGRTVWEEALPLAWSSSQHPLYRITAEGAFFTPVIRSRRITGG